MYRSGEYQLELNIFNKLLYLYYPVIFYYLIKLEKNEMYVVRFATIFLVAIIMYFQSFSVSSILLFLIMLLFSRCTPISIKPHQFFSLFLFLQIPVFLKSMYTASAKGQQHFYERFIAIINNYYNDFYAILLMVNSKINSIEVLGILIKNKVYYGSGASFARSMTTFIPKSMLGMSTDAETLGNKFFNSNIHSSNAGGMNVTFFGAGYMSGGILGVVIFSILLGLALKYLDELRVKVRLPIHLIFINTLFVYGVVFFLRTGGPAITMKRLWLIMFGFILYLTLKQAFSTRKRL